VSPPEVTFTNHAIKRYRQRIDPRATMADIDALVAAGRISNTPPGSLQVATMADAYLIAAGAVFPLLTTRHGYVAMTCLNARRNRLSKVDRRARRELARFDDQLTTHRLEVA
jgi:hypothetical protein